MSVRHLCDGCGADMGSCRFPAVIEIGPNAGKPGMLATRLELRPVDAVNGREVDVCRECIIKGLARVDQRELGSASLDHAAIIQ